MWPEPSELTNSIARFRKDHPDQTRTAFVMMEFGTSKAHAQIVDGIKITLQSKEIVGLRADDKEYHDDLFSNVLTYIYGCSFGVAVFERIENDRFNSNVALEVGYMTAMGKPVCLLKDRTASHTRRRSKHAREKLY